MKGRKERNRAEGVASFCASERNYSIERDGIPTLSRNCANSIEREVLPNIIEFLLGTPRDSNL